MTNARSCVIVLATCVAGATAYADEPDDPDEPEQPSGRFEVGAGFNADDGFIAHAAIAQDDLFDTGQRLALTADLSERWQTFRIVHGVDDLLGSGLDLQTELFSDRRAMPGFTRERNGGALTLSRQVDAATRVYLRGGLEQIDVTLDGDDAIARANTPAARALGDGLLATLRAGVVHDTLDDPLLPRHGRRVEVFAETAGDAYQQLGGSIDDARALGPFTLRLHGHAGYVRSDGPGGVPLAFRLQHDGHADVRGYALPTRFDAGDNLEAIGRAELELPIWPSAGLSLAGFADVGLRANTDAVWGATTPELMRSVGVGLIWRSPIGPLRFDWAIPLDADDQTPQFLFTLGGAF
jgi:outer membrane protein insertion porin family